MAQRIKGRVRHPIYHKLLAGYLALTLLVVVLTGAVTFILVRRSVINSNLNDLMQKAEAVAEMLSRPDGRMRVLTVRGLHEIETLSGAQLIYVDSDMVARQMPLKRSYFFSSAPAQTSDDPPESYDGHDRGAALKSEIARRFDAYYGRLAVTEQLDEDSEAELRRVNLTGSVDEQLIRSIMAGERATDVRTLHFMEHPVLFAGIPITDDNASDVSAAIILCRPMTDIGTETTKVLMMLSFAGAAAILCAVALAYFMSRRIAEPIASLSGIAERMADGEYGERIHLNQGDEIGQLGDALNQLSSRLGEVIGTLCDEKSKLEMVLSSIGEGIIAVDKNGRVIHHNAAALNLLELRDWDVHPENPNALNQQQQLVDRIGQSMAERARIVTSWQTVDGRSIEAIASPVVSVDGETSGAVCLVRDVTEHQKLEQMRREYIANISHELRTPLTGIRAMVEPLMDGLMETESERDGCYQVIYDETIRLEKLIGEMLDMSRLQSGRIALELEPMQPFGILQAAATRMESRAENSGVALSVTCEDGLWLMGHEDRILQVLIILLDNALSFTPRGGHVTLEALRAGERVQLRVSDSGCGIDPVDLPYIWERFYKADRSRMRTSGTGLGLAIAKLVVELMDGEIDVNTAPGAGTTFTITLNAPSEAPQSSPSRQ